MVAEIDEDEAARQAVKVFKALADTTRYRIIQMLVKGELGCADFNREFNLSVPAMSHHLHVLENAGLVSMRKAGTHIFIRLNAEYLQRFVPGFAQAHADAGRAK